MCQMWKEDWNRMTYSLPFGLKQKPVNKYFEGGVIKFSCREGQLNFEVKQITKSTNGTIYKGTVNDKTQLDKLLSVKTIYDVLRSIEVVQ